MTTTLPDRVANLPAGKTWQDAQAKAAKERRAKATADLKALELEAGRRLAELRQARDAANQEVRRLQGLLQQAQRAAGVAAAALMSESGRLMNERSRLEAEAGP